MSQDPLIPFGWDIALYVWTAFVLIVLTVGVVSTVRTHRLSAPSKIVWVVAQLLLPLIGTIAWFVFGYRSLRRRLTTE